LNLEKIKDKVDTLTSLSEQHHNLGNFVHGHDNQTGEPPASTEKHKMGCNLHMGEQECFDNFMSKFTAYTAQAGITRWQE
jgi:hypothetical protein